MNARKENMSAGTFFKCPPVWGGLRWTNRHPSTKVQDWSEAFLHVLNAHDMQERLRAMSSRVPQGRPRPNKRQSQKYKCCKVIACVGKTCARSAKYSACPLAVRQHSWQVCKQIYVNNIYPGVTEKAMAPHSSTLAWKSPWMEEPGGLQSMGSLRVGHDWATSLSLFTYIHWRRKWQPTPVFLPGESQGQRSLVGCRLWGRTESDTTEVT